MQRLDLVAATDAEPADEHVGHRLAARLAAERGLQLRAERVLVELDDVGRGRDAVLLQEYLLRLAGMGAVALGEYYDCGGEADGRSADVLDLVA